MVNLESSLLQKLRAYSGASLFSVLAEQCEVNIPVNDEAGVAMPRDVFQGFSHDFDYYSRSKAPDARNAGYKIGFLPGSERACSNFIMKQLGPNLVVLPRRSVIDTTSDWSKLVIVVFVKYDDHVVLVPRTNVSILNNTGTLSVLESVISQDFTDFSGGDNQSIRRLAMRAIREECDYLPWEGVQFTGLVGGRIGDLGLVYGLECKSLGQLRYIAEQTGGVLFDAYKYRYETVAEHYNVQPDGWSSAILQYIQGDRMTERLR